MVSRFPIDTLALDCGFKEALSIFSWMMLNEGHGMIGLHRLPR